MIEVSTIGLDIAMQVFHVHAADVSGAAIFSKKIARSRLLSFFASQPRCLVAMEACGGAHHWGRELTKMGHRVCLIPPAYVKPFDDHSRRRPRHSSSRCSPRPTTRRFCTLVLRAQRGSARVHILLARLEQALYPAFAG